MSKILQVFTLHAAVVLFPLLAQAQSAAEMLQKFQQLPPEQQQQLMEAAKNQKVPGLPGAAAANGSSTSQPVTEPVVVTPLAPTDPAQPAAAAPEAPKSTEAAPDTSTETVVVDDDELAEAPLKPFGYDLFAGAPTTFAPATDIPVPSDYLMGPGDTVEVQLFGKLNTSYSLVVQRDGAVHFPELGPIQVAGLSFDNMRQLLQDEIKRKLIGVQSSVTLGQLRSIRVFVLGDARRPGSYTVSSLSTITNALFVSGGIAETGSLRKVQLKRGGRLVNTLDLYDLLLRGDTSGDSRLQPGDVIFIPPAGMTVGIASGVRRPAIYELLGAASVNDVIGLAGGLLSTAAPAETRVDRIAEGNAKTVLDVDLTKQGAGLRVKDGDVIRIASVLERVEGSIFLTGHVHRPSAFKWQEGMRIRDVLPRPDVMKPLPDLDFGLIVREDPAVKTISVLSFTPREALSGRNADANLALQPRDTIYVFGLQNDRADNLKPVLETLSIQSRKTGREEVVSVGGEVNAPGAYPLFARMTVHDLIRASLGMTPDADREYAVLVREDVEQHRISVVAIDLRSRPGKGGDPDIALEPKDRLLIFGARQDRAELLKPILDRLTQQASLQEPAKIVRITGPVRFPGTYPLAEDMTLIDLIGVSGGLAEPAYALSAEIGRSTPDQDKGYSVAAIPVNLAEETAGTSAFALQSEDVLQIKRLPNYKPTGTVILEGEFVFPGEYRIQDGETLSQLIKRAGGFTTDAHLNASLFVRQSLKATETKQLEIQKKQLEKDLLRLQIAASSDEDSDRKAEAFRVSEQLISQLSNIQAVGRMVIDLPEVAKGNATFDVRLEDGDTLHVGRRPEAVSVFGEVLYPASHQFRSRLDTYDYINRSGGTTQTADKSRIYIVRANGEIIAHAGAWWFMAMDVWPGDTVVVPYDATRLDKLKLSTNIVQIVSQLAITAASLKAVGAF